MSAHAWTTDHSFGAGLALSRSDGRLGDVAPPVGLSVAATAVGRWLTTPLRIEILLRKLLGHGGRHTMSSSPPYPPPPSKKAARMTPGGCLLLPALLLLVAIGLLYLILR